MQRLLRGLRRRSFRQDVILRIAGQVRNRTELKFQHLALIHETRVGRSNLLQAHRGALAGKCLLMCFGPLTGLALLAAGRRWRRSRRSCCACLPHPHARTAPVFRDEFDASRLKRSAHNPLICGDHRNRAIRLFGSLNGRKVDARALC